MSDQTQNDITISEHDALNEIPSGVGIFDVTGSVISLKYLNNGFYRMIGARREDRSEFLNTGTINSVHPEDRAGLLSEAMSSIRENRVFDYRFRNLDGKGSYMWIGIQASHKPLNEKTERFFASYYNVDRFINERDELAAYGNKLDEILGSIPGGVAVFSERGGSIRLDYTNAGFHTLHHGSREYWSKQSRNPVDWLVLEDRHLFWDEFQKVALGNKKQGSVSYRIIGEDGAFHWVNNQFCRADRLDGVQYYYASFIDMDEQIAAEQELLQNKLMYDDAAKSAKLIIWSYDITAHRAIMMQSGYTEEICRKLHVPAIIENVVETLLPHIHPDDRAVFRSAYQSIDDGAESAECEFRFQMPGQKSQQQERIVLRKVTDKYGRLLNVFCYGQNITEQRRKEFDYEQTYRQLNQAYPHPLGSFHLNLTKNWCGDGKSPLPFVMKQQQSGTVDGYFLEFSKLIADENIKADFYKRFDRELLLKEFEAGTTKASIEYPIVYEDGTRCWRDGMLFMLKNPKTGDVEAITYAVDIDKRKKNEFIVAKLINDHFDYIGIIHPKARTFEFHSRRPWIIYGDIGEVLSYEKCCEFVRALFTVDSELRAFDEIASLDAIIRDLDEEGVRSVSYLRTAGGKTECIRLQYSWLEKAGGDIMVVRSDITDAYQKEQQQMLLLEEEKRAAETANIAKSDFLSRMSHDIRTPLNGIIGMTYLLEKMELPDKVRDNLSKIDTSSKFLLGLINDVLDMSKAESGKIELHPEPYSQQEFASYMEAVIKPLITDKNQKIDYDIHMPEHVIPLQDKLRTNQIVFNILSNAVKFTPEGGKIKYTETGKMISDGSMLLHIEVSDNGVGMSEEFQKILFDPFSQEGRNDNSNQRGTGLGMTITKRLVDLMGGAICVESKPGRGTTFFLNLPVQTVSDDMAADIHYPAAKTEGPDDCLLAGKHVLLCEDHPLNQEIAKALLADKKINVSVAEDGKIGLETFEKSSPGFFDAILMDIRMPVMDGIEATKAIRALDRPDAQTVPVIAMTAAAFSEDVQRCLDAGMNGHVAKPIDPDQLYQTLSVLILENEKEAAENE